MPGQSSQVFTDMTLGDIVRHLGEEEQSELRQRYEGNPSLTAMLITAVLENPGLTGAEFIRAHKTTKGTFDKTQSQAIDQVYDMLKRRLNNPYDPIMLVRKLLLLGLPRQARKLYNELEKEYQRELRYGVLDALYHEGVRLAYESGDITWLRELEGRVNENSARLREYNRLDKALSCQMLELERARSQTRMDAGREKVLRKLHRDAVRAEHPVLMINALYCQHVYYLRHRFDLERASKALGEIVRTADAWQGTLDGYSAAIASANYISFLCTYALEESPEPYFARVDAAIADGGTLGLLVSHFQRFRYFLFTGQREKAQREYATLSDLSSDNRFHPLKSVAAAWLAFAEKDTTGYAEAHGAFYEHPGHRDVPEHEFELRAIDLLLAIRRGDEMDILYKGEALRKFAERRFQEPHMEEYRRLLGTLTAMARRRKPRKGHGQGIGDFKLRSHRYLLLQGRGAATEP